MISSKRRKNFMEIAYVISKMSTCKRAQVWCVIIKDWMILWTWYNWNARWEEHCIDIWCKMIDWHCSSIHSEENAIINCAYNWVSTKWASIYCTHIPCDKCSRRLVNAWIEQVRYDNDYRTEEKVFTSDLIIFRNINEYNNI